MLYIYIYCLAITKFLTASHSGNKGLLRTHDVVTNTYFYCVFCSDVLMLYA